MKKFLKNLYIKLKNKSSLVISKDVSIYAQLGEHVRIYENTLIDKNVSIGRYSYVSNNSKIYSNTSIGAFCSIGPNVIISPGEHSYNNLTTHPILYDKSWNNNITVSECINRKTIIENDVWIGCNAIIKSGITIGTGAIIGAGAVVTKDVLPYSIVAGNPAKIIKYRFEKNKIDELLTEKWWEKEIDEILEISANIMKGN